LTLWFLLVLQGAEGIPFEPEGIPFKSKGIPFKPEGIPFKPKGIPVKPKGIPFKSEGIPFKPEGIPATLYGKKSSGAVSYFRGKRNTQKERLDATHLTPSNSAP
jgi:hypothetical protein